MATRKASEKVINSLAAVVPELWGGSADLAESNDTTIAGGGDFLPADSAVPGASPYGRVLHFGIREHAMGAILNGIALHGLTRPFGGTFLVFSDYMRGAVRLAALMGIPSLFVWTHDSIGLGEDGPTHQPIEHLWALRAIPGLAVVRPADANETAQAWAAALQSERPRRAGPHPPEPARARPTRPAPARPGRRPRRLRPGRGLRRPAAGPAARHRLRGAARAARRARPSRPRGSPTRVVSMPCLEWFDEQPERVPRGGAAHGRAGPGQRRGGLGAGVVEVRRQRRRGRRARPLRRLGSAERLYSEFGITAEAVAEAARGALARQG